MLASKFITSAVAALTIVGTAGMVVAQTTPSDATMTAPATTAPADTSVQTAPAVTIPSAPATSTAPADGPMTTEAQPAVQPDRN